ncbi:unnamed protein product [Tenebrio molitor]|jgi:superfamily II DNA/RNA helicase|nr:unnamed protein product [Tenebrio molitor]
MEKEKTVTLYIPSGMKMGLVTEPLRAQKKQKSSISSNNRKVSTKEENNFTETKFSPENYEINKPKNAQDKNYNTPQISKHSDVQNKMGNKITPPKTICRNRSLKVEQYNFKINENIIYDVDINSMKVNLEDCKNAILPSQNNDFYNKKTELVKSNESSLMSRNHTFKSDDKTEDRRKNTTDMLQETKTCENIFLKSRLCEQLRKSKGNCTAVNNNNDQTIETCVKNIKKDTQELQQQKSRKLECNCTKCDKFVDCSAWCCNNIEFGDNSSFKKVLALLKSDTNRKEMPIKSITNDKMVLHGAVISKPVSSLENTSFDEYIQGALKSHNCAIATNMQSYVWPAVQRGLNVFMVGAPQTGKTLAYLPSFCTSALEKSGRYLELSDYEGPLVVLLCSDSKKCDALEGLIKSLITDCWDIATVSVLKDSSVHINCDILISVPSILEESLKLETVRLKRLCHVAIEDAHVLLKTHNQSMEKLFTVMNKLQINRPHNKNIQIVVSSEKWSPDLDTLLKKLYTRPLVYIEDFLEAALYSNIKFKTKKVKSSHKLFYLEDILKTNYRSHRTIVFCKDKEILDISEYLKICGVECITISNDLMEDEIHENENLWCSLNTETYKVLLTTDALFEKTQHVLNASWIVHYSFPSNWSYFQKRFRSLAENLYTPFNVDSKTSLDRCSFLIIDENSNEETFINTFTEVITRNLIKYFQL